ncbi:MAG: FAD-binding oxidoreductase, partial [Saprospiraceae bacterium]
MNFFKIKVDKITKETEDAISISFRLDNDHALRQYYPGQYLTVKYHLKEEQFLRCYSLSSLPSDEYLTFTVKKTLKGFISRELVEKTKVGSELEIGEPHGKFKISPYQNNRRSHYFIAAGSGITPIMSMIQFLLEEEPSSSIYLLYSNSDEKDIIFYQKIQELESKYSGQLKTFFTLSKKEKKLNLKLFSKDKMKWSG